MSASTPNLEINSEDLDALPVGTVVWTGPRSTWEKVGPGHLDWVSTGGASCDFPAVDASRRARVLLLPGEAS